jgi:predicted methyltransferase
MRMMFLLPLLVAGAAVTPALAKPADFAATVADKGRSADNRKQDEGRKPAAVLDFAGFKRGDTVVDLIAGGGYYSELIARVVGPKGNVMPLNSPVMHDAAKWAPILKRYPNVTPMVVAADHAQLAPHSVDHIFAHMTYHDLYWESEKFKFPRLDVDAVVRNWFSAVRPGGSIVIIDHVGPTGDTRANVDKLHRIDPAVVRADMERAGFVYDGSSDALRNPADKVDVLVFDPSVRGKTDRFMMKFRRP